MTVHLLMLATMWPYMVFACLPVRLTFWIVTALLSFILINWTLAKITYGKTFDKVNTPGE